VTNKPCSRCGGSRHDTWSCNVVYRVNDLCKGCCPACNGTGEAQRETCQHNCFIGPDGGHWTESGPCPRQSFHDKEDSGTGQQTQRCDHEFADTKHCVKCGWVPQEADFPKQTQRKETGTK